MKIQINILLIIVAFCILYNNLCFAADDDISYVNMHERAIVFIHVPDPNTKDEAYSTLYKWTISWNVVNNMNSLIIIHNIDKITMKIDASIFDIAITVDNLVSMIPDQHERNFDIEIERFDIEIEKFEDDYLNTFNEILKYRRRNMQIAILEAKHNTLLKKQAAIERDMAWWKQWLNDLGSGNYKNRIKNEVLNDLLDQGEIAGGFYAKYSFNGPANDLNDTWNHFIKVLMKNKYYKISEGPCFEIYTTKLVQGNMQEIDIDLFIPVEKK